MKYKKIITNHSKSKCKFCNEKIKSGKKAFVLYDIHVSPKYVKLFFHEKCFDLIAKSFYDNIVNEDEDTLESIPGCPFCGRLPEPELFSHNSIKPDSWYIYCDCGKVSIKDCDSMEEALIEWSERY